MEYLVIGLGNPGKEYRLTRHNAGFLVVELLMKELRAEPALPDCAALVSRARRGEHRILLAKPQTFMNLSGKAVRLLILKYEIPLSRTIIILDDLALPFGMIRLRSGGSAGGHKGLASVLAVTGEDLPRLRMGIGAPPAAVETASFVLNRFSPEEKALLPAITDWAGRAVLTWIEQGIEAAMSRYNGLVPALRDHPDQG
ncbi:MAG: aminoacyl-tRNA hydrolase [Firmicutes bacterium]|nr:aminoacyl-tRNA hydrolase [Bacillota bacterium]